MSKVIVSDASTLILLEKIALLEKLTKKFRFIIPAEIYDEAVAKGKAIKSNDAYSIENKINKNLIRVEKIKDADKLNQIISEFDLARGEAEAIVLFFEQDGYLLASDDHKAINVCKIYKMPFITALAFVIKSFNEKVIKIDDAKEMIKLLSIYGRYKDELVYKALNYLGGKND